MWVGSSQIWKFFLHKNFGLIFRSPTIRAPMKVFSVNAPITHINCLGMTLKTLTSLNKEVRPFFLGETSIWRFPLCLPLAITAFGGPESYFSLAIIAFGSFEFIVPKY